MRFEKIKGPQNHHLFRPIGEDGEVRPVIWVRFHRTGPGRLEESLRTFNLGDAREKRDRRIAEFLGEKPRTKHKNVLIGDKFPDFLELKKQKSKATYESMRNQWEQHLKGYFETKLADEVTPSEWLRYVAWKRAQEKMALRKFFNDRKYLSMFLHWLHQDGLLSKVPKLANVDPPTDAGRALDEDEVEAILAKATGALRDQVIMALTMGMRHGEIWSLEWKQIDWKAHTIGLPAGKTKIREARTFRMSEAGEIVLKDRQTTSESGWVFPHPKDAKRAAGRFGEKSAWDKCRDLAQVDARFHDLRHTFLTRAFKTSTNPALICAYAGLSLEEAYRTYLHFDAEDTKRVAELVGIKA